MSITILDGGMGQELMRRSGDAPTPLWSTQVMIDHPELVRDVHADFFAAGAQVATTNTYAVLRDRLQKYGHEDQFEALIDAALGIAEAARDAAGGGRIAASLGPIAASYRPDLCPPPDEAAVIYAELVALMKDRADMLVFETMSSVAQAEGGLMAARAADKPVWVALSVMDNDGARLRSGEPLGDAARLVTDYAPDAVLLNCSRPEAISEGLKIVADFGVPFGAYANGFTTISEGFLGAAPTVDALQARKDLGPRDYADFAQGWVDLGATIIGGCCEVGPEHIAELTRRFA